jgi:EAL domain-containing protein (putative c-di-GMP-specific phosphodiesterase class I)
MDSLTTILALKQSALRAGDVGLLSLGSRDMLLAQMYSTNTTDIVEGAAFLVVINIADTKEYSDIIRIFGYKFADDMLDIRLETIALEAPETKFYHVGYWSIGFIFRPSEAENRDSFLNRLVFSLSKPIICRGIPIPIKPGIGICDIKKGIGSANDVLQSTFLAGQASSRSSTGWTECNYDLADDHRRSFLIIADFEYSLSQANEFELYFQPRLDLRTRRYTGAEALLRWRHPNLGSIVPNEFIPLVEKTGLIRELTRWVLTHAIAETAKLHKKGYKIQISVNISPKNLDESDFVPHVLALLDYHGLAHDVLEIELSENSVFKNTEMARERLVELRKSGINIAIDDFGTGRDSFGFIRAMPINILKIDGPLVASMNNNIRSQAIVKSIIGLGHETGMSIVGKGIENKDELDMLMNWSCDYVQGYFLGAPMNIDDFAVWCAQNYQ